MAHCWYSVQQLGLSCHCCSYRKQSYVGGAVQAEYDESSHNNRRIVMTTTAGVLVSINTRTGKSGKRCDVHVYTPTHTYTVHTNTHTHTYVYRHMQMHKHAHKHRHIQMYIHEEVVFFLAASPQYCFHP